MRIQGWCSISTTVGLSPGCFLKQDEMKLLAISEMETGYVMLTAMMLRAVSIICARRRVV